MLKQLLALLFCLLALTACGSKTSPSRVDDFTPLTAMQVVVSPSIANKTSTPVTVIGDFSGKFSRDVTGEVALTSSAPGVADFTITALPTRLKSTTDGTTTITATSSRWGISSTATVTVKTLTLSSIDIQPANPSMPKGTTKQFSATGNFSDGTTLSSQDITIDADWVSDTPTTATVGDTIPGKGLVTAIDNGASSLTANITAKLTALSVVTGSTTVTVTPPVPVSIAVTPANPTLLSITTTQFTATATYSDSTTSDITKLATWSSSAPATATVDNGATTQGKAFALATGTTQVNATFEKITGTTNLKVTGGNLSSITLYTGLPESRSIVNTNMTLIKGNFLRLSAVGTFSPSNISRDITSSLTWTTDLTGKVVLNQQVDSSLLWLEGRTTTDTNIPVNVTGKFGTTTTSSAVTVSAPTLNINGLTISSPPADLTVGASARLTLTGTFSDGTVQDLTNGATWNASSNPTVLSVGDSFDNRTKGKILALADGANITLSATFSGQTSPEVTVNSIVSRALQTLTVTGLSGNIIAGNQANATVTAGFSGKNEVVTDDCKFSIDNTNIAQIVDSASLPGSIVGIAPGTATLTITYPHPSGSKSITQIITVQ